MGRLVDQLSEVNVETKSQNCSEEWDAAERVSQSMSGRLKSPTTLMSLQGMAARSDRQDTDDEI